MNNKSLSDSFLSVLNQLKKMPQMDLSRLNAKNKASYEIHEMIKKQADEQHSERFINEFFDLGPLQKIVQNPDVTEIIVNGKEKVFYEIKGQLHLLDDQFLSHLTFNNFIHRICEESRIVLTLQNPFADGKWRSWRLHIARQPVVNVPFHLCFRKQPENPWTFETLKNQGWAPQHIISKIKTLIADRKNILIAGSTSSGKTSVLNACLQSLPANERIITIEDSSELLLPNPFSTKLLTRSIEGLPTIEQNALVRQSLRMRPDRVIMGEARGQEAKDLLLALAAGHSGSLGTIHASDHRQALWRLEMLVQMGAPSWNNHTIQQMIALSIHYIFVLGRVEKERKLLSIYKLCGVEKTGYLFEAVFVSQSQTQFQELFPQQGGGC